MASILDKSLDQVRRESTNKPVFGKPRTAPAPPPAAETEGRWAHDMYSAQASPPKPARFDPNRGPNLLVLNLHYNVSEAELEALFGQIGKIERGPCIKWTRDGRSEGEAYIGYENEGFAEEAMRAFNGAPAKGEPIELRYADMPPLWARKQLGHSANALLGRIDAGRDRRRGPATPYEPPTLRSSGFGPRGAPRGSRGGIAPRGASRGGRGGRGGGARAPANAADLDKELEAFMGEPKTDDVTMAG